MHGTKKTPAKSGGLWSAYVYDGYHFSIYAKRKKKKTTTINTPNAAECNMAQ